MRILRGLESVVGLVFVASAALKATDMTSFAVQISYYGIVKEPTAVLAVAYVTVAIEALLGGLLLTGVRLRGLTWATTLVLLAAFTALLLYAWVFKDLEDCGCFGKYLEMTPGVSIAKNVVLAALLIGPWWMIRRRSGEAVREAHVPRVRFKRLAVSALCVVCVLGTSAFCHDRSAADPTESDAASGDRPFAKFQVADDGAVRHLGEGEFLVAMLNATCEHCQGSVDVLNELTHTPGMPPVVALMLGDDDQLKAFRDKTKPGFPTKLVEILDFFQFIGDAPPRLIHVRDGEQVRFWDEDDLDAEKIADALLN